MLQQLLWFRLGQLWMRHRLQLRERLRLLRLLPERMLRRLCQQMQWLQWMQSGLWLQRLRFRLMPCKRPLRMQHLRLRDLLLIPLA